MRREGGTIEGEEETMEDTGGRLTRVISLLREGETQNNWGPFRLEDARFHDG